jgi:hypothetical protein
MATYKVWLTIKDSYGNIKEVDGGSISLDLAELGDEDLTKIEAALPLEQYIKKDEAVSELDPNFATDAELMQATQNTLKYADFELQPAEGSVN